MKNFKIKMKNEKNELELAVDSIETREELNFIKNILSSVDIHTSYYQMNEEKTLNQLAEGYNVLKSDKEGLHRTRSEFEDTQMIHSFPNAKKHSELNEKLDKASAEMNALVNDDLNETIGC